MSAGMYELSQHILAVAHRKGTPITNFQLQKIVFFSVGMHLRQVGEIDELAKATYNKRISKGLLGPILYEEFFRYTQYKEGDILEPGIYNPLYAGWDEAIEKLCLIDAFSLSKVAMSFASWDNHEEEIRRFPHSYMYTLEEVLNDFKK